jgi:hypothetical protein
MFTVVACRGNLFSDKYRVSTPHGRERRLILQISNKNQHFKVAWADSLCVVGKPEVGPETGLEEINGDLLEADLSGTEPSDPLLFC